MKTNGAEERMCFVCGRAIRPHRREDGQMVGLPVRIGPELWRHPACEPGSPRYMAKRALATVFCGVMGYSGVKEARRCLGIKRLKNHTTTARRTETVKPRTRATTRTKGAKLLMWQDWVMAICSVVFSWALVPQVVRGFKDRQGYVEGWTAAPYTMAVVAVAVSLLTLRLWFAGAVGMASAGLWAVLWLQREFYGKPCNWINADKNAWRRPESWK